MILETTARNAAAAALGSLVDNGYIQFETSGDVEVATLPLSATAFGAPSTGVITAAAITSDTNATGGTIAQASFYDDTDAKHYEMTCGTSGAEINLSSLSIGAGDTVSMSSLTITVPAS